MDNETFAELCASVREMTEVARGDQEPHRRVILEPTRVTQTRQAMALSQQQFARLMGVSLRTLQNWEQGHREPTGPAKMLLKVARHRPDALMNVAKEPD